MAIFPEGDPREEKYPYLQAYTAVLKKMERPLIGREKEMEKLMAAMRRPELCNVILLANAGSGKALANDTPIAVADDRGYVNISDIKVDDHVYGRDGKPTKVLGVFPQGELDAYEVTFSDNTSIICNDEHIWSVRNYVTGGQYEDKTLREILNEGLYADPESGQINKWYIPVCDAIDRPKADLKLPPYVTGAMIMIAEQDDDVVTLSKDRYPESFVARMAEQLDVKICESPHGAWPAWHFASTSGISGSYISISELFETSGYKSVFGCSVFERRIPSACFNSSFEQRWELLRGLMDSGGVLSDDVHKVCQLTVPNEELAHDILRLVSSLGFRAEYYDNNSGGFTIYFIIENERKVELFSIPEKKKLVAERLAAHRSIPHGVVFSAERSIKSVKKLDRQIGMTCIYVDAPDHLFAAGLDHIVTHNTALVQGTRLRDPDRVYLEVDLPRMISNLKNENEMADKLKQLFREIVEYRYEYGKEIVLFIDEFHQIVQLSAAAVEVLKPLLADSGTRGIRVIAATTYIEFQDYVASNQPLVERLQRINLAEPTKDVVVEILRGMAERYGVADQFATDQMFEAIYEYTNRYVPANAQPRKSILMLDSMIGWHRQTGRDIDMKMLADVIYDTEGINIAFRVKASEIKAKLDEVVIAQEYASTAIENRLQICCADLNNKERPMSSFLFTGSTGVGKSTTCSTSIPVYTPDGEVDHKLAGEIEPGDYVFDRNGKPTKVLGVFPQGKRDVYRVTLGDGRTLDVSDNHLWAVYPAKRPRDEGFTIYSTQTLLNKGLETKHHDRVGMKYFIPMNGAVEWPEKVYDVDPYVIGAAIGNGLMREKNAFIISSGDEFVVSKIAKLIGAASYEKETTTYSWHFYTDEMTKNGRRNIQLKDVCGKYPEIYDQYSKNRRIPKAYMTGSVAQRWTLVNGLFDTDGTISAHDGERYNISYSTFSKDLAYDIQELLYSLGVSSTVNMHHREREDNGKVRILNEYDVHVCSCNADKCKYFSLPRKLDIAKKACSVNKQREKMFNYVGIRSIEKLDHQEDMVCFYVENDEHLYQAGQYIVTHNTEMTKQLAKILFDSERNLIRIDMTEYALDESLERFRDELTQKVWARPYSIVLLDEIEKACPPVTRLLLQVLDDGRLIDRNNREVTFKNCYIIVTTNAGSEIYKTIAQFNVDNKGSGSFVADYEALIRESISSTTGGGRFPAELLGRIDCIVPFQPLSEETMGKIVVMKLHKIRDLVYKKHGLNVVFDRAIIRYIVQEKMSTDSDAGGARAVISRLEREVITPIAKFVNDIDRARVKDNMIYAYVMGDMAVDDKLKLKSTAYIKVDYDAKRIE